VHRADARIKFLAAIAFIVAVSLLPVGAYLALAVAWAATLAVAVLAHLGPARTVRASFVALPFLLAAVPLIFTRPEDPLGRLDLGPLGLTISGEGLRQFTTIALKSWISVQAAMLLAFTTPFHELVDGLRQLRLPRIMVSIISFMYRYLAVLTDEASRLMRARAARSGGREGTRSGGSVRWRATVTGRMAGSLFLRSYERSERIYAAMQARGFEGTLRHMHGRGMTVRELGALAMIVVLLVGFELIAHGLVPRR
jgi:cobalt/nickel transport system permease protein